ncbi:MAG: radical SAM family heme chaperone HemW [Phycisphaerae bacterium]|jgi:oxygen-independent coproporphyrinogen-3 oxidase
MGPPRNHTPKPGANVALYVHTPFCHTTCGYCDFYSVPLTTSGVDELVQGVREELTSQVGSDGPRVRTIFWGGGTPTVLPTSSFAALLDDLALIARRDECVEFSVEANPGTVDEEKAALLAGAGVDRVSVGAQSFNACELSVLERIHDPDDVVASVRRLRRFGIGQINLDLIFGIPGQTLGTWDESLRRVIELGPDHVASYGLTYEPGTRLAAQRTQGLVTPCNEDLEADLYLHAIDTLSAAGYRQYEISNFAKPGCECLHNLAYWRNQPYLGVGPSAAGCVGGRRYKNVSDIAEYIRLMDARGHAEVESEVIDVPKLMIEMIMMQLRLAEGLSIADFHKRAGVDPLTLLGARLGPLVDRGLTTVSDTQIALTRAGRLVADAVIAELAGTCRGDVPGVD